MFKLFLAVKNGDIETVNRLLADGTAPNQSPEILKFAAGTGHNKIIDSLIARGADPGLSLTSLNEVTSLCNFEGINNLLSVWPTTREHWTFDTAIHTAREMGNVKITQALENHIPPLAQPHSLKNMSRCCIRRRLSERLEEDQQPIKPAIESLPLPQPLRSYVFNPLTAIGK